MTMKAVVPSNHLPGVDQHLLNIDETLIQLKTEATEIRYVTRTNTFTWSFK